MPPERHLLRLNHRGPWDLVSVDDWLGNMAARGLSVTAEDRPRLGCAYRLRSGDTPDSRWLVDNENTIMLNETAAEIISRCDGCHSVSRLIDEVKALYSGARDDEVDGAIHSFLELALNKGWISVDREFSGGRARS